MKSQYRVTSLAVLVMACGGISNEGTTEGGLRLGAESAADSPGCVNGTTSSGWLSGGIGGNTGKLKVTLDATPGTDSDDAVVGFGPGAPTAYSDLAAMVRFNADGKVDARDGGAYRALTDAPYQAGELHHLSFQLDTTSHTYSAWDDNGSSSRLIAANFAFRTEQANASELAFYGLKVDSGGPLSVCNVFALAECTSAGPGDGFVNVAIAPQRAFLTFEFDATPNEANVDTVIGVSPAAATSFNDVAVAVRFNSDGVIDARDGDVYRPVLQNYQPYGEYHYEAGTTYHFVVLIDIVAHKYNVVLSGGQVLHDLAFRTQQANASSLGNLVLQSDTDTGTITRCATGLSSAQGAIYMHDIGTGSNRPLPVPLPDGRHLLVGPTETSVFDAAGLAAGTAPVTGALAADAAGNLYKTGTFSGTFDAGTGPLTSAGGVDAYVVKYDATFSPVWSARFGGAEDDTISAPQVNANGDVLFVLDGKLARLDTEGNVAYDAVPVSAGARLAIAPDGSVFASDDPPATNALSITKRDPSGATVWTHVMPKEGTVTLGALVADASGGAVFSGKIDGQVDLGGHMYQLRPGENGAQVYVAKLDGSGSYVYANTTDFAYFGGLSADGRGNVAASGTHGNGFYPVLDEYGPDGALRRLVTGGTILPPLPVGGSTIPVVSDWSGNLYWSFSVGPDAIANYFVKLPAN